MISTMFGRPLTCGVLHVLPRLLRSRAREPLSNGAVSTLASNTSTSPGPRRWRHLEHQCTARGPDQVRLDVIRALDTAVGLERVSSMAARTGAIAAVNAGYFRTSGEFLGESTGTLQIDHVIWSEPDRGRASVGMVREGREQPIDFRPRAVAGEHRGRWSDARNRRRQSRTRRGRAHRLLPQLGAAAVTDATGSEVVVRGGRVVEFTTTPGARRYQGMDSSCQHAVSRASGRVARRKGRGSPRDDADAGGLDSQLVEDIVGGGPRLVTDGRVDVTDEREQMVSRPSARRHIRAPPLPRSPMDGPCCWLRTAVIPPSASASGSTISRGC